MSLNLARRPFVNVRPVTRLAVALWILGSALAVWNGMEIWRLWGDLSEGRRALADAEGRAAAGQARIEALQAELRGINLQAENEETAFLNREIARRTLSWTSLFQHLSEVLPRQVRLVQIVPTLATPAQRRGSQPVAPSEEWIQLGLKGYAESDEALLDFVDALFSHPSFDAPDLQREAVPPGEPVQFDLRVAYRSRSTARSIESATVPSAPASAAGESISAAATSRLGAPASSSSASNPSASASSAAPFPSPRTAATAPPPSAEKATAALAPGPGGAPRAAETEVPPTGEAAAEPAMGAAGTAPGTARPSESTARWAPRPGREPLAGSTAFPAGFASPENGGTLGGVQPVPLGVVASGTRRIR